MRDFTRPDTYKINYNLHNDSDYDQVVAEAQQRQINQESNARSAADDQLIGTMCTQANALYQQLKYENKKPSVIGTLVTVGLLAVGFTAVCIIASKTGK